MPLPPTRTLPPKVIHHQAMSKLKVVLSHVHTADDLDFVETGLDAMM
jgi:dihydroorotase